MPGAKVTSTIDDQSVRVVSTSSYNAAVVIEAKKGPIDRAIKVNGQTDFLRRFTPNERYNIGDDLAILEAFRYLEDESGLYVVRCAHTEDIKTSGAIFTLASSGSDNQTFTSTTTYRTGLTYAQSQSLDVNGDWTAGNTDACIIYASSPGVFGNDITVEVVTDEERVRVPGAFLVKVYSNRILKETFTCSLDPSLKSGYGVNCSIDKVLKGSNYIRGVSNTISDRLIETVYEVKIISGTKTFIGYTRTQGAADANVQANDIYETEYCLVKFDFASRGIQSTAGKYTGNTKKHYALPKAGSVTLSAGSDGSLVTTGDKIRALKKLENMNNVDVQLIWDGGVAIEEYQSAISDVCDKRKNSCHGIICTPIEDEVSNDYVTDLTTYRKYKLNINSYSMELYSPHQKYYDQFNDREVWLSPGPYVASLIMKTARERGWHWAVAGYNRGVVQSLDVAQVFEDPDIDTLSDNQVNSIKKDPGSGNIIWDELTLLSTPQDLQDAHISRWINIYLRPALEELLKSFLFEFNDEETRALIVKKIETFMAPQKVARACYAYRVVCDESNNLPDDIENNTLNCWLYVKPTKIAKWINQRIIITPYSTDLETLEV